jgi:hypothetical protein
MLLPTATVSLPAPLAVVPDCDGASPFPAVVDALTILGALLSFLVAGRVLFVYRQLVPDRYGNSRAACFVEAMKLLREERRALYGEAENPSMAYDALVRVHQQRERAGAALGRGSSPRSGWGSPWSQPAPPPALEPPAMHNRPDESKSYGALLAAGHSSRAPQQHRSEWGYGGTDAGGGSSTWSAFLAEYEPAFDPRQEVRDRGVSTDGLRYWLSWIHNPLNDMWATIIIVELLQVLCFFIIASASLARRGQGYQCLSDSSVDDMPSDVPPGAPTACIEHETFSPTLCDASATVTQFFNGTALGGITLYCVMLAFPTIAQGFRYRRATWQLTFVVVSMLFGVITTITLWMALPLQPWGSRFERSLPWCWVPVKDGSGDYAWWQMTLLKVLASYAWVVVILIAGARAYFKIASIVHYLLEARYTGKQTPFAIPRGFENILRRAALQAVVIAFNYGMCAAVRVSYDASDDVALLAVSALSFALLPGANAALWAYGEGILVPAFGRGGLEEAVGRSFSHLAIHALALRPMHATIGTRQQPPAAASSRAAQSETVVDHESFATGVPSRDDGDQ